MPQALRDDTSRDDARVRAVLHAVAAGSVPAVGDLFDLVGTDVWRVAAALCADPALAEEITLSVFRAAWQRPETVPSTYDGARHHLATRAGAVAALLAAPTTRCTTHPTERGVR